jgi:hypothetical protein
MFTIIYNEGMGFTEIRKTYDTLKELLQNNQNILNNNARIYKNNILIFKN